MLSSLDYFPPGTETAAFGATPREPVQADSPPEIARDRARSREIARRTAQAACQAGARSREIVRDCAVPPPPARPPSQDMHALCRSPRPPGGPYPPSPRPAMLVPPTVRSRRSRASRAVSLRTITSGSTGRRGYNNYSTRTVACHVHGATIAAVTATATAPPQGHSNNSARHVAGFHRRRRRLVRQRADIAVPRAR